MKYQSKFIHFHSRNASEMVVCEMAVILSRLHCVKQWVKRPLECYLILTEALCCIKPIQGGWVRHDVRLQLPTHSHEPGQQEISWRRHQMETFSALLAICAGNSLVTGEFPAQRPVTRTFDVFLICAWIKDCVQIEMLVIWDARINGWVNNRDAGDLNYDVTVM